MRKKRKTGVVCIYKDIWKSIRTHTAETNVLKIDLKLCPVLLSGRNKNLDNTRSMNWFVCPRWETCLGRSLRGSSPSSTSPAGQTSGCPSPLLACSSSSRKWRIATPSMPGPLWFTVGKWIKAHTLLLLPVLSCVFGCVPHTSHNMSYFCPSARAWGGQVPSLWSMPCWTWWSLRGRWTCLASSPGSEPNAVRWSRLM